MTILERKAELVKSILNDVDEDRLNELEMIYYHGLSKNEMAPCQYSVEELKERSKQAIEDVEAGRVVPHESLTSGIAGEIRRK